MRKQENPMPTYNQQNLTQRLVGARPLQPLSGEPGVIDMTLNTLGIKPETSLLLTPPLQDTSWNRIIGGHAP